MYFTAATYTKDELSAEYKTLAKKLHPDVKGGSESAFKAMKAEYDQINKELESDPMGVWVKDKPAHNIYTFDFTKHPTPNKPLTPEDIKKAAEALETILNLFRRK